MAYIQRHPTIILDSATAKKKRRSHRKVHSGCRTCKIRRKKCDETKPCCRRCTSTGRTCDGYDFIAEPHAVEAPKKGATLPQQFSAPQPDTSQHPDPGKVTYRGSLPFLYNPASYAFATDFESSCYQFFLERTGPLFSRHFDSSFWTRACLRTSASHRAVQQAVSAVGAAHRRYELGHAPEAYRWHDFAFRQYTQAVSSLRQDLDTESLDTRNAALTCAILFGALETFQKNHEATVSHFSNGFRILLGNKIQHLGSETAYHDGKVNPKNLRKLSDLLDETMEGYFGRPARVYLPSSDSWEIPPDLPKVFQDLDEARDSLCTLKHRLVHCMTTSQGQDLHIASNHDDFVLRLLQWCAVYGISFTDSEMQNSDKTLALYLYREMIYLYLLYPFTRDSQSPRSRTPSPLLRCYATTLSSDQRRDAINEAFTKTVARAQSLHHPSNPFGIQGTPDLVLESGLVPASDGHPLRLHSTKVRHQVMSLLSAPDTDTLQDSLGSYLVSERVGALEEAAMVHAGVLPRSDAARSVQLIVWLEERMFARTVCEKIRGREAFVWKTDWIRF